MSLLAIVLVAHLAGEPSIPCQMAGYTEPCDQRSDLTLIERVSAWVKDQAADDDKALTSPNALAALAAVVAMHRNHGGDCPEIRVIAKALHLAPQSKIDSDDPMDRKLWEQEYASGKTKLSLRKWQEDLH